MQRLSTAKARQAYLLALAALLLFVLPLAHVTALRGLAMGGTALAALFALRRQAIPRVPLLWPLALWTLAGALSLPGALDAPQSLEDFKKDVLYSLVVYGSFFALAQDLAVYARLRRVAAASLMLASCAAALSFHRYGEWRIGLFNALGEYCTFVILTLPLLLTALLPGALQARRAERIFVAVSLLAAAYGVFLARSRGSWILLAGIAVALLVHAGSRARWRRSVLVAAAVAILAGALVAAESVSRQRNTELTALHHRGEIYAFALGQIAKHPLTGVGFGKESDRAAYGRAFPGRLFWHAHNVVLGYAEQMGVAGVLALVALFGGLAWRFRAFLRARDARLSLIGATGLALCVSYFLKNMTDMFFYGQSLWLFWAHCGLLIGLGQRLQAQNPAAQDHDIVNMP